MSKKTQALNEKGINKLIREALTKKRLKMITLAKRKKHINRAIDTLILTSEDLKKKETLGRKDIKKLSRIMEDAALDIFIFIGVAPENVRSCYKMHIYHIQQTGGKIGYLPILKSDHNRP
jgi:adenine deaminase